MALFERVWRWITTGGIPSPHVPPPPSNPKRHWNRLAERAKESVPTAALMIKAPILPAGVVPAGVKAPVMAMDSYGYSPDAFAGYGMGYGVMSGFPGYPYLAMLATRPEYRAFASGISTELTREWITVNSSESAGNTTKERVTELAQAIAAMGLRQIIEMSAQHDSYYGRGQILSIWRTSKISQSL